MVTFVDFNKFSSLVTRAIAAGASMTGGSVVWDASLGCEAPYPVQIASRQPDKATQAVVEVRDDRSMFLNIETPCRKCRVCMNNRRILWTRRAKLEIRAWPRTWFITFTVNPHHRFRFSLQSGSRDYMDTHTIISAELTKYFKRLRKKGATFRYVLVAEAHKDGYPHFHALLHEVDQPITKSRLQEEWPYGFTTAKLVKDEAAAHYVAKYLAKDARTRIRASQHYGLYVHDQFSDTLLAQSETNPTKSPKRIVF